MSKRRMVSSIAMTVLLVALPFVVSPSASAAPLTQCSATSVTLFIFAPGFQFQDATSTNGSVVPDAGIVIEGTEPQFDVTITPSGTPGSSLVTLMFTFDSAPVNIVYNVIVGSSSSNSLNGSSGDDIIFGFGGNDRILANNGDDIVCAGDGSDSPSGGLGDDHILGQNGNDIMLGGPGDDVLSGEAGNDLMFGDYGVDTLVGGTGGDGFRGGPDTDFNNDFNPGEGDTTDGT